ncbi:HPr kinase [Acidocella aquatica]|uniref:HPr kinase n=1 Tax=Acidocella aquatica TaxID=1922313 RepID=A0ABQ6A8L8_9PROT|nr:nucleotide-binding domain containing protein [Acidocella aquatica]GLR66479.1 HPr kinase [Acidocella aquatica]
MLQLTPSALAWTLQDAAALTYARGAGSSLARGHDAANAVLAPGGLTLSGQEVMAGLQTNPARRFFSFGNQEAPPDLEALAPVLDCLIEQSGTGFMVASFAAPAQGRTVYQGHLFQDGRLVVNVHHALRAALSGRVAIVAHETVAAGAPAIRRKLAAFKEQGAALALLDAVDMAQCAALAAAVESQALSGGPAWLYPALSSPAEAGDDTGAPEGPLAILSGALDRQTLFQLGAARHLRPFLQLDFAAPNPAAEALAWARAQGGQPIIIAASTSPGNLRRDVPAAAILAEIAAGLATAGVRRFVLTGNDTASAILDRLEVRSLETGAAAAGLRWLSGGNYHFLLKPGGFGGRDLLVDEFEPQIRLNATAE